MSITPADATLVFDEVADILMDELDVGAALTHAFTWEWARDSMALLRAGCVYVEVPPSGIYANYV